MKTYRMFIDIVSAKDKIEAYKRLDEIVTQALKDDSSVAEYFDIQESPFTGEEELTIFELARVALSDAEIFDHIVDKLDLSDNDGKELQEKIENYMQ